MTAAAAKFQFLLQVNGGDYMDKGHTDFSCNDQENKVWKGPLRNELRFSRVQYKAWVHVLSFREGQTFFGLWLLRGEVSETAETAGHRAHIWKSPYLAYLSLNNPDTSPQTSNILYCPNTYLNELFALYSSSNTHPTTLPSLFSHQ